MDNDYYIVKVLHIYYNETVYIVHELDESLDIINENIDSLTPLILYENGTFNKLSIEKKYKSSIEQEIKRYNIKWSQIYRIIVVDEKYLKTNGL